MRFIDLYNKNKNSNIFKHKLHIFKTYCYLAKNNPERYKIVFREEYGKRYFSYLENSNIEGVSCWHELENSNGAYKEMGDFKEKRY